ncbi:MAG: hypothetical protein ACON5N_09180 [Akkermansiaceae bacterium]
MKTINIIACSLLLSLLPCLAGGNSSIVDLDKVTSIKIEDGKITIVGDGMIRKRVISDQAHGDAKVFGQPAQMLHAKVRDCTFEIVPYHVGDDLKGVPGPAPKDMTPEMKAQSQKWWQGTLESAKTIKVGDAITIGYQREKMTLTSVWVSHIIGSGSLRLRMIEEK